MKFELEVVVTTKRDQFVYSRFSQKHVCGTETDLGPDYMSWFREPGCFGVPRWLSARYYMRRASPVDDWCDEPRETWASLILEWRRTYESGWPGKPDYMEESQPG